MSHYGITWTEYLELFKYQKGVCAICGIKLEILAPGKEGWHEGSRTEVDHEHGTELPKKQTVRGLLCGGKWSGCNRKIGRIDNIKWLTSVVDYLKVPPAREMFRGKNE